MDSEHPGVPQRPPAYAHLLIDSTDRAPPTLAYQSPANDFIINQNQALLNGYFTRLAITQLQFNWKVPTVISEYNDLFYIGVPGTPVTWYEVNLPSGYYSPVELAAEIQTAIQANAPLAAFTCIWNPTYNCFQIESNTATNFFIPSAATLALSVNPPTPPVIIGSDLAKRIDRTRYLIGANNTPSQVPIVSPNPLLLAPPNMLITPYVDIVSRNLTKYQRVKDIDTAQTNTKSFIIARLYLTPPGQRVLDLSGSWPGSQPFDICVDYNTPKMIRWSPNEAIFQLDLQVLDQYGDLLYWDAVDAPWEYQLTLVASET